MNNRFLAAVIILIVLLIVYRWRASRLTKISAGGYRKWNVVADYDNAHEAAELLARVNSTMIEFMRYLEKKYHIDETDDVIDAESRGDKHNRIKNAPNNIYNIVDNLLNNYNLDTMYENDPRFSSDTSYTLNKGASMHVCLRDKVDPTKLVDFDTLLFVMLHEASHIANYNGWGHDNQFWQTFKFILHEAVLAGIYKPVNYKTRPKNYCGLEIAYQPLHDGSLANLWE
jgi:hypothetical protein